MFIVAPIIDSTDLEIVAEAGLRCGDFLSEKSCHKLVVSTSFWSLLLNISSVLTSLIYTATLFRVVNALWVCWRFTEVLGFDFGFRVSEICLFCVHPWCDLLWYKFSLFRTVWLVKKSWSVHCCSIHRFYWRSDRCRSGFALWLFFVRKKMSSQIGSSTGFWSWILNVSQFWHLRNTQRQFFGLLLPCGCAKGSWDYKVFDFGLYVSKICHLCLSLMRSFVVQFFFRISGHYVANYVLLMCSLLFHSSGLLR